MEEEEVQPFVCCECSAVSAALSDSQEKGAEWSELFMDLILVAACSNIADGLKEDLSWDGLYTFLSIFAPVTSMWHINTSFNTRFNDKSVVYMVLLFGHIVGFAGMVGRLLPRVLTAASCTDCCLVY